MKEDISQFCRQLRLREYFYDPDENTNQNKKLFKERSKWTPPINRDPALEIYITKIKEEIDRELDRGPKNRSNDNISQEERKALASLRRRKDIIIKPADKGSATIVMARDDYLANVMNRIIWTTHDFINECQMT